MSDTPTCTPRTCAMVKEAALCLQNAESWLLHGNVSKAILRAEVALRVLREHGDGTCEENAKCRQG